MLLANRQTKLERGIVEIGDRSVGGQFHRRVGIELGEVSQPLHLSLSLVPFQRHRQQRGDG